MPAIKIHEYMLGGSGARNLGFQAAEGVNVLVQPSGAEHQSRAQQIAVAFADAALEYEANRQVHQALQAANESLAEQLRKARARVDELNAALGAAITGRRRFNGPALLKPERDGEWTGAVWLLDPQKEERGFGLRFDSLAEVRRAHPELWVVGVVGGGVLLDGFAEVAR